MKKSDVFWIALFVFFCISVVFLLAKATGAEEAGRVNKSGKDSSVVSRYTIQKAPQLDGCSTGYRIYDTGSPVVSRFTVSPSGTVYRTGNPVTPVARVRGNTKNGR